MQDLDPANREAWQLFNQVACRICMDIPGLAAPVLARVVSEKDAEDATDLLQRLAVIYDAVRPPPDPT